MNKTDRIIWFQLKCHPSYSFRMIEAAKVGKKSPKQMAKKSKNITILSQVKSFSPEIDRRLLHENREREEERVRESAR